MEFEIDELAFDAPWAGEEEVVSGNTAPQWCREGAGSGQTGVWIPEEGRALTAKRVEPAL